MSRANRTDAARWDDLDRSIDLIHRPRPSQGGQAARDGIRRAQHLAALVRDEGPDGIGAYLDDLDQNQLYALTVTLAAMVPLDQPADDLLAWLEPVGIDLERAAQRAANRRHRDKNRAA